MASGALRTMALLTVAVHTMAVLWQVGEAERRVLLDDFAAADVRDLPTFTRSMDRLANDVACLRRRQLSVQQQQVV